MMIRRANMDDLAFLTEAVIAAEKSGTEVLSYSRIFGIPEQEFSQLLPEMLAEDIEGQELCISGFLVAEDNGEPAAAVCAWVEAENGMSSGQLKASLLMQYLDMNKMSKAAALSPLLEKVQLQRQPGNIQLECIYTRPLHRGKGLAASLIKAHLAESPDKSAEIIVSAQNNAAIKAYEKAGFSISEQKFSDDPELLKYLPHLGKLKLQRQI